MLTLAVGEQDVARLVGYLATLSAAQAWLLVIATGLAYFLLLFRTSSPLFQG